MRPDARLLAIEIDPALHAHAANVIRDPRLTVHLGSAEQLAEALAIYQLPAPDVVVSCLPFSTMPPELANRIAAEIARVLAPAGRLVAYQARAQLPRHATPHLGAPEWQWEWFNIPPVRVFTWTKGLAQAR